MPESGVKLILPTMSPTKLASVVTIGEPGLGLRLDLRRRDCEAASSQRQNGALGLGAAPGWSKEKQA